MLLSFLMFPVNSQLNVICNRVKFLDISLILKPMKSNQIDLKCNLKEITYWEMIHLHSSWDNFWDNFTSLSLALCVCVCVCVCILFLSQKKGEKGCCRSYHKMILLIIYMFWKEFVSCIDMLKSKFLFIGIILWQIGLNYIHMALVGNV